MSLQGSLTCGVALRVSDLKGVDQVWRPGMMAPVTDDFLALLLKEGAVSKLAACRARYYAERVIQVRIKRPAGPNSLS
jgi:hypothetical protein